MFVPDDPRLRHFASSIAEARRHRLETALDDRETREAPDLGEDDGQLSLFAVHSATATEADIEEHSEDIFADHDDGNFEDARHSDVDDADLVIDLTMLPPVSALTQGGEVNSRTERERLRSVNSQWVRDLVAMTGLGHAQINSELNRVSGVRKVSEATVQQLTKRAKSASDWFDRERRRASVR